MHTGDYPNLYILFGVSTSEIITALKYIQIQLFNLKCNTEIHLSDCIQADFGSVFTSELSAFCQFTRMYV